jgi:hypothetical protein
LNQSLGSIDVGFVPGSASGVDGKGNIMAGKPVPVPVRDPEGIVLCIEDIRKSALKKLPKGIAGTSYRMIQLSPAASIPCTVDKLVLQQIPFT